jgi:DNA-binding PadR family transcriptional regulator
MGVTSELMKGNYDIILLHLLSNSEAAMSAYQIAKTITRRSQGDIYVNIASLYTALQRLVKGKLLSVEERTPPEGGNTVRFYTITTQGLDALEARKAAKAEVERVTNAFLNSFGLIRKVV